MTPNTRSLERLSAAINEFHRWVELPRHQPLCAKLMFEFGPHTTWDDSYKNDAGLPGCYIFEDSQGELYYVGSVSANSSFGYRFANGYICKHPEDAKRIMQLGNAIGCERIYVIDVEKTHAFIAPALEQFLISYLRPKNNRKDCVVALQLQLIAEGKIEQIAVDESIGGLGLDSQTLVTARNDCQDSP